MKKTLQLIALSFFIGGSLSAQETQNVVMPCATYEAMEQAFQADPSARARFDAEQEKLRIATEEYEASLKNQKTGAAFQYTIPVVFHILHTYGAENISDATCINALANINNDFAKAGSDVSTIDPNFASLYINSDIKFMLAHKDPSGNCTSGINHYYNTSTDWNQNAPNYAYSGTAAGKWNPTKYLNIYIVRSICPNTATCSASGGVVVGYTYKPGTWPSGASQDAFVFRASFVSTDPRSMSHEIGHWLNLSHTWGNTNQPGVACGNDGVGDTPITKGFFSTCPGAPYSGCSATENVENIMDYSSCPKMFTTGQTNVMRAALASGTSGRNNLWTTTNLGATQTDVNGTGTCAPKADCYATYGAMINVYTVCSGGSLTFYDASYNGPVTSRNWSVTGGAVVANPTAASTGITFPSVGSYTVTLTAGNATGTTTATRVVTAVNGVANYAATYQESFEATGLPANWAVINQTGGVTWTQYFGAAATGNGSYYMNNSMNPNGAIDVFETPSYDFLNNPGATFTFKYAYAKYSATNADVFKVQASSNCGGSWTDIFLPTNTSMATGSGGVTSTPFYPTSTQYKTYTLTSHPAFNTFKLQPNVKIRFYFMEDPTAGFGNNIFLDDINFNAPMSVNELSKSIGFSIYPNPTNSSCNIEFTLSENASVKYFVSDIIGRIVEKEKALDLNAGYHKFVINESQKLSQGVYMVNFELNGQKISRKLIVE